MSQNNLSIFATFYLTALWLEMAEGWDDPWMTFFSLIAFLGIILTRVNKLNFSIVIALNTIYFLYFHFPEVANHVNLIIFINFSILATTIYSWLSPHQFLQQQDYDEKIAPVLRVALIFVYFWAGFHKLNKDFFISQYSCSNSMLTGIIEMATSSFLGLPVFIFVSIILFVFTINVVPDRIWYWARINIKKIILFGAACLFILLLLLLSLFYLEKSIFSLIILTTSIAVLLWELVGAVMLLLPRWQQAMFFLSMSVHLILSLIGFVDFGALAFALWLAFIPNHYYTYFEQSLNIHPCNFKIKRSLLYVLINIFSGLISGIYHLAYPNFNIKAISGILFIISVLITVLPLVKLSLISPSSWQGISIINSQQSKFILIFSISLFLYGATPYLGLRTAGNFSMFSNLRTEGLTSNHLLLGSNSVKIWDYQEDVVKIIKINDVKAKIGHKYIPLQDHYLPVVEFKKLIYKWTKAKYKVSLVFEYRDQLYTTNDIANDPFWRTPKRNWEMILMDFRVIQPNNGEPNYCRW